VNPKWQRRRCLAKVREVQRRCRQARWRCNAMVGGKGDIEDMFGGEKVMARCGGRA